jgi:hypothetical protein
MDTSQLVGATESTWGGASHDSNDVARKHFNIFLKEYYLPSRPELAEALFGLPLEHADLDYDKIPLAKRKLLDFKVFNEFGEYLPKFAKNQNNKTSQLAYESGSRYLSSMVTRINNDLRKQNNGRNHLAKAGTDKIWLGMRNLFVKDAIEVTSHYRTRTRMPAERILLQLFCSACGLWTSNLRSLHFS